MSFGHALVAKILQHSPNYNFCSKLELLVAEQLTMQTGSLNRI